MGLESNLMTNDATLDLGFRSAAVRAGSMLGWASLAAVFAGLARSLSD